ncbi:MAG: hypothetical protein A2580_17370 [Hydrogenophilales bacterium RIFOXYD1_FULL_62_11]|nr:MAG: hypothetical protein A2580_17370 [Hydrogenophilales bacterium RIFOXYD1_FULL_62_11]
MILEALLKAVESDESLRVRYFGGSSPGSERELMPLSIKDGKVRARCLSSGETKTFFIEKMEPVIDGVPSTLAASFPTPESVYASVEEFLNHKTAALQEMGWVVKHEGEFVTLHRTFKNGKIRTSDVSLQYEEMTFDLIFDGDQVIEANHRKRSRPWIVGGKKQTTKTFGDFGKAQQAFLAFAKSLAPNQAA